MGRMLEWKPCVKGMESNKGETVKERNRQRIPISSNAMAIKLPVHRGMPS